MLVRRANVYRSLCKLAPASYQPAVFLHRLFFLLALASYQPAVFLHRLFFIFANYTIHRSHSQRMYTHSYEYTHANPTPRSIFEYCVGKSSRLTKSPQARRCRRERRLPLKAQTPLNPEKFAPTGSRTQDLRCYRGFCNH
jgi:hypothetical protein